MLVLSSMAREATSVGPKRPTPPEVFSISASKAMLVYGQGFLDLSAEALGVFKSRVAAAFKSNSQSMDVTIRSAF